MIIARRHNTQVTVLPHLKCYRAQYGSLRSGCYRGEGAVPADNEMTIDQRRQVPEEAATPLSRPGSSRERPAVDRDGPRDRASSQELGPAPQPALPGALPTREPSKPALWTGSRTGGGHRLGKRGLPLWWLQPALWPTAQHLARFGELQLTPDLEAQLAQISVSTLQRLLHGSVDRPAAYPRKGRNRRTGCTRRSRCGASLGRRSSPDTARWIWSIMPRKAWGSMAIPCN